jgi:hypothetical protein
MATPAIHDFFRKIKLISPDGSTVQSTIEADSVTDELTLSASEGLAFVPDAETDSIKLDVDYAFYSPVGTTKLRLEDVNNNVREVNLRGGLGVTIARAASDDIVFSSYSVAEIDTLQSVTARGFISGEDLIVNNLTVGKVNSLAGIDGMSAQDSRFTGDGTLYTPLRIDPAEAEVTTATYSETFTFSTAAADGVLTYAVAYDNPVNVTTASMVFEREDPNNPGTWITLESITNPTAGAYVAANNYSEAYDGAVNYRLVFNFTGNTDTIILTGEFSYEVLDIAEDPALQTDSANEKVTVKKFENTALHETNAQDLTNLYDLKLKNLTSGRVPFVNADKKLVDSANFTFNSSTNTLNVSNLSTTGDITIGGAITIGDGEGDTIDFAAGASSNFVPASTNTYSIGTSALQWGAGYFDSLYVESGIYGGPLNTDDIRIAGNRIETTASNANFEVGVNGTGNIQLLAETTISGNTIINETTSTTDPALTVNGNTDLNGELLINGQVFVKTFDSNNNYGLGADSLINLTSGISNVSLGYESLVSTTTGSNNTLLGYRAGKVIQSGTGNTGVGAQTLSAVSSGTYNTAIGFNAGAAILSGSNNIIIGNSAAASTTTTSNEITLGNANVTRFRIPGLSIDTTATGAFKLPAGTGDPDETPNTALNQRPSGTAGMVRYNSTKGAFEGYDGTDWLILNGLQDTDQDTYIGVDTSEAGTATDSDSLTFVTRGVTRATLSPNSLVFSSTIPVSIPNTTTTLAVGQGALVVGGGVSIAGNLIVGGDIINANIQSENSVGVEGTTSGGQTTDVVVSSGDIGSFSEGNYVRIYGASATNTAQGNTGLGLSLARVGFSTPGAGTATTFNYRVAQFDFTTGKVSAADPAVSIDVLTSEITSFNNTNNIQLTLSRETTGKGILVYRLVGLETAFKLIAVLGPKELGTATGSIPWTDYYDYDYTPWSGKSPTNTFETSSGVIHMPIEAPGSSKLGWFDTRVDAVDTNTNTITVEDQFYGETDVWIYNDDTVDVQTQIDINVNTNINTLKLDARVYFISNLDMPRNFSLYGLGEQTIVNKLPWSTNIGTNLNSMFDVTGNLTGYNRVSLSQMYINGNSQNQYLVDDSSTEHANYAIRFIGEDVSIQNIELTNVCGGGIWLYDEVVTTEQVSVYQNQINSGCLTYRYEYSPINVTQGKSVRVTQNSIKDFPNYVDFSAVEKGVISNNIIDNCGSGIFGFGIINSILNPNVLVGAAGEFIPNPDILNSEYDSVNIILEPGVDFNSTTVVYQENGLNFDLSANQGYLTGYINELKKINGLEVISTDYSQTTGGTDYVSFIGSPTVDPTEGELRFRIVASLVNDLLSRASFETLYAADTNSIGLIYRIVHTEYVPLTNLVAQSPVTNADQGSGVYRVEVEDVSGFNENDIVRLVGHSTTPSLAGVDGTIVAINNVTKLIDIDFGVTVTAPASDGTLALQNNMVVVKGKIN